MKKHLISAAVLCVASGMAIAQDADCCTKSEGAQATRTGEDSGQFVVHSQHPGAAAIGAAAVGQPEVEVKSHVMMIQKTDDREVKVEVTDGRVKAWVDGEAVPEKRVKVTDQKIRVLAEDGQTIAEFGYSAEPRAGGGQQFQIFTDRRLDGPDGPIVWEGEDGMHPDMNFQVFGDDGNKMFLRQPEGEHPSVMIGISMGSLEGAEVDERVSEVLADREIDAGDVFVVQSVIEGTPAAEAGVREGDVVVRVDGKWGVRSEQLREVLMDKEPGDMLELAVIRKGKLREIEVELAPWDIEKLGVPQTFTLGGEMPGMFFQKGEGGDLDGLQALIEGLKAHRGEMGEDLERQFEVIIKQLGEGREDGQAGLPGLDVRPRIQLRRLGEGREPQMLVRPAPTPRADARTDLATDSQARLERIEARLEKLEHQIDRLINALQDRERDED